MPLVFYLYGKIKSFYLRLVVWKEIVVYLTKIGIKYMAHNIVGRDKVYYNRYVD